MFNQISLIHFKKQLLFFGGVTVSYFLLGLLGLLFKVPAEPIWLIMPSAGLAFVAALHFGMPILPAIGIGSFCVSACYFNFNQNYLYFYLASAVGSILSALIAFLWVRKTIGFSEPLIDARKILMILCLIGSVSLLPLVLISVTAMHTVGIITLNDLPVAYLTTWFANILGLLIFSPLFMALFAEPKSLWNRRRLTVGLPIILTFALVVLLSFYLNSVLQYQDNELRTKESVLIARELKNRIELDKSYLYAARDYLAGSKPLSPDEFFLLAKQALSPYKEVQSISWVNLTEAGSDQNRIINVHGGLVTKASKSEQSIPPFLREKFQIRQSAPKADFILTEQNRLKFYIPVVSGINDEKNIRLIIASVSLEVLVQQVLETLNKSHYLLRISELLENAKTERIIYSNIGSSAHSPFVTIPISVANQALKLSFYDDWAVETLNKNWPAVLIVYSALWFSAFLGIFLLILTGRNFRTEAVIDMRTKVLTETKIAAERANQAKNQFLAKISHELRTPLNGISGFAQLLEKKPSLNAEDKKQVAIIKQCSDDLLGLINDILDISAIETQQIKLEVSEFNFTILLNDSIRICKLRADDKGIKLICKNNCQFRKLLGDEKRIRQILVNLIDNAVKYTNQGSVKVEASYQDNILLIAVADTGSGIAEKDLELIFTPFVQVNTGSFTREGIGLGLPITKELVNLMDGDLSVTSEMGVGSTFAVKLPLQVSQKNPDRILLPNSSNEAADFSGATVLVVDDSQINVLFLVSMLKQLSCKVESASNGQEALTLIKQNHYDFALIDINMPILNGIDLVKILREQKVKLKLVAVSAYADEAKINEALSAGFDIYITKPVEEYQLIDLIQASKV